MNIFKRFKRGDKPRTTASMSAGKRFAIKAGIWFVVAAAIVAGLYAFASSRAFTLTKVAVSGTKNLSHQDVLDIMGIKGGENLVFLRLSRLHDRLHSSPWIRAARLRKTLPGVLEVAIDETDPVAILSGERGLALLDFDGNVLRALDEGHGFRLPVIEYAKSDASPALREALALAEVLRDTVVRRSGQDVLIHGLEDGPRNISIVVDGIEIRMGESNHKDKLARLFAFADEIKKRDMPIEYIDLRFNKRVVVKAAVSEELTR